MSDIRRRVERAVARAAQREGLWEPGAPLVVAVSGGPDSLCLLGALVALRDAGHPAAPAALTVAHLDHGLRPESAADAAWVRDFAATLGVPAATERADVAWLARREKRSLEDAARTARYAFLRRVAADVGAAAIATGHTRNDQAETVILHWLRGAGLAGLSGMAARSGDVVRPLLGITREQTVAYCAAHGWEPLNDATNADPRFTRNRIRHELLPLLETFNAGIHDQLARNAAILRADNHYLETQTDAAWARLVAVTADGVCLAREALREEPPALRYRLYQRAVERLAPGGGALEVRHLEARHIAAVDALLERRQIGASLHLPGGLSVRLDYNALVFEMAAPHAEPPAHEWELSVPGTLDLPELGWRLRAWRMEELPGSERDDGPPEVPPVTLADRSGELGRAESRVYLDASAAGDALPVRTWRPGDRIYPLGMRQVKKVQDLFSDAKVARELRHRLPLVFGREHLLWVAGVRVDDRARLTPATTDVLVLQLEPLPPLAP